MWRPRLGSHVGQVERVIHVLLVVGVVHARRHVPTVEPAAGVVPQLASEAFRDDLQGMRPGLSSVAPWHPFWRVGVLKVGSQTTTYAELLLLVSCGSCWRRVAMRRFRSMALTQCWGICS